MQAFSPLPDDAGTGLLHNMTVNYGEDAYGGYDDYENHAQGTVISVLCSKSLSYFFSPTC